METISKHPIRITQTLLFIVTITTLINSNNANNKLHIFSHSLPLPLTTQPPSPSPSHAPAPSPTHHRHHHHAHHHVYAPSPQPSQHVTPSPQPAPTGSHPPAKPVTPSRPVGAKPVYPPVKGPVTGPMPVGVKRKFVAVQGMVYCKSNCSFTGVNTLLGASPLPGARVVLRCKNTKYILRKTATTDKNGYFFLQGPQLLTTFGAHKCKVYLAHQKTNQTSSTGSGSLGPCSNSKATDLNNGSTGAYLFSNSTGPPRPLPSFSLFSVGPFAYESAKCH